MNLNEYLAKYPKTQIFHCNDSKAEWSEENICEFFIGNGLKEKASFAHLISQKVKIYKSSH